MANTTRDGTDGTDQFFGIPSASQDWAVKRGWIPVWDRDPSAGEQCACGGSVKVLCFSQWARWLAVQHAVSPWPLGARGLAVRARE